MFSRARTGAHHTAVNKRRDRVGIDISQLERGGRRLQGGMSQERRKGPKQRSLRGEATNRREGSKGVGPKGRILRGGA